MRDGHFERLRAVLVDRGVSARYAHRLVSELEDHYADAAAARLAAGDSPAVANANVFDLIGSDASIVAEVLARPELRGRCCNLRAALRPLLVQRFGAGVIGLDEVLTGPAIARWGASITFGSMVTVALMFLMARTVVLGV